MAVIALCDCDNFFVSCERIARPDLEHEPAVVLSSNDGCIIARSAEVKAMGVQMGEPYFKLRFLLERKGVHVFSGRLPYYRSVSAKVMQVLSRYTDVIEQYSIDEAFLNFNIKCVADRAAYAHTIREAVRRLVGVPISIGIAPTKTLAKLASKVAKKGGGVYELTEEDRTDLLEATSIGDVWGIGRRSEELLRRWGIRTAGDLVRRDPIWVSDKLKSHGAVTQAELMGVSCIPLDPTEKPPKSIQSSHAFGKALSSWDDIQLAVTEHAMRAGRSLRSHTLAASGMSVFLLEGYISREHRFLSADGRFERPAVDDQTLIRAALRLLRRIYAEGKFYTRAGLTLSGLSDSRYRQRFLFDAADPQETQAERERREHFERASAAVDEINAHLGRRAVYPASLAVQDKPWKTKGEMRASDEPEIGL